MSNPDDMDKLQEGARERAYGQNRRASVLDRFGVWLSAQQIRRYAGSLHGKSLGDFGCGYHATFVRSVLSELREAVVVDFKLSPELRTLNKVRAIEGILPGILNQIASASLDLVLCISVLEHLWDPVLALQECLRIAKPGGLCLFNVPSWRGKRALEYSTFRLSMGPKDEMDDHKMYYDVKDFWPLLVRAGFRPSNIKCFSHKFGMNTFAVCRVPGTTSKTKS